VDCPHCQHANRDGASFCESCGAALDRVCSACGTAARPSARFCDHCGAHLERGPEDPAATPAPPEAAGPPRSEHRIVTVLFIDAVGSVAATERMPAEAHHNAVRECTELMAVAVRRFGGTVTQFRGDGIMAVFGAPIAHEYSARRAIAAALEMQASLDDYARAQRARGDRPFSYRIGINTGPVIVGAIGSDNSFDYTAVGDTVNLASRMEQWAPPGRIYITENTQRHVFSYFELRDLGQLEVRGKSELVRAYEVVRELPHRTRLDASLERGLTRYVGRVGELSTLRNYYEEAATGRGQVVFISGEAGIGKSRLLFEFRRSLENDARWIEGQCISFGSGMPYLPLIDLVRAYFGIEEGATTADIEEKVHVGSAVWEPGDRRFVPHLLFLLNALPAQAEELDPAARRAGLIDALRTLILRGSAQQPIVIVVEDLHWIDQMSEGALAALVDVIANARVLIILTYRPGYTHSLGERTYYSRIALQSFGGAESDQLVEFVLDSAQLPMQLRAAITRRAEGNPFYIEEVARSLFESGVIRRENGRCVLVKPIEQVRIPETLQEVILTRIDRLEQQAREAIQLAAVIGREFTVRLLQRMSETHAQLEGVLTELKSLELIYETQHVPELAYMFKHALTHEVALSTLLSERRRMLHALVARSIRELYSDRLASQYEVLAHHYYEGEDWPNAFEYLVKSGHKARDAFAINAALAFYERAIGIVERGAIAGDPDSLIRDLRGWRGTCFYLVGQWAEARTELTASVDGARAEDSEERANRMLDLALSCFWLLDVPTARTYAQHGLAIAERIGSQRALTTAWGTIAAIGTSEGNVEQSLVEFGRVVKQLEGSPAVGFPPRLLDHYTLLAYWTGGVDEAISLSTKNTALEREFNDVQNLMQGLPHLGLALAAAGRYTDALQVFAEARATGERYEVHTLLARALCMSTGMLNDLGDFDEAEERAREVQDIARAANFMPPVISSNLDLLFNFIRRGDVGRASELAPGAGEAIAGARGWHGWLFGLRYREALAELALATGDLDRAIEHASEAVIQCREKLRGKYEALAQRTRGIALLQKGDRAEAAEALRAALHVAQQFNDPSLIVRVAAAALPLEDRAFIESGHVSLERILSDLKPSPLRAAVEDSEAVRALRAAT
jgi:class 3 adenylate cyclase/tetratricopeptide (TPR) repeat protein